MRKKTGTSAVVVQPKEKSAQHEDPNEMVDRIASDSFASSNEPYVQGSGRLDYGPPSGGDWESSEAELMGNLQPENTVAAPTVPPEAEDPTFVGPTINITGSVPKPAQIESNEALQSDFEHQPLATMTGLSAERFTVDVQDQGNNPYEASNKAARKLSPFTISLLPPKEVMDANKNTSSGNSDPYSWDSLTTLLDKSKINIYDAQSETNDVSGDKLKSSQKIGNQIQRNNEMNKAISGLEMLVYNGQLTPMVEETLNGVQNYGATPLFNAANLADIYMQLLEMFRTPPLILLVNPTSMNINYSKLQNFQERTRYGYVFQAWGEQLPVMNFSGRIGGYYGGESLNDKRSTYKDKVLKDQETTHVSGLQEASRRVSPAYQNLMQLLMFYKNNGYIRDTVGDSQANHLIGMIEISYDGVRYVGHFDKLEWTFEEANNLGGVNFSFDFTATRIVHTDERNAIPMKMNNPNQGHRFGEDRNDGRARTMQQFQDRFAENPSAQFGENTLYTVDDNGEVQASDAVRSWRAQAADTVLGQTTERIVQELLDEEDYEYPSEDTGGIMRSEKYHPEDFED